MGAVMTMEIPTEVERELRGIERILEDLRGDVAYYQSEVDSIRKRIYRYEREREELLLQIQGQMTFDDVEEA